MDYQRLLLDHLDLIAQIVRTTGRRRHLSAPEREDFASFVHLRLIEDDYAILRKFQNRSTLWTYLAMVIERLSLDFCAEKWGRWRPSAMAERLGAIAVNLERLVTRDNHTVDEAIEILRTNHEVSLSHAELRGIWEQLPTRTRTTSVGEEAAAAVSSDDSSDTTIEEAARRTRIERLQRALQSAFDQIPAQDRVLIALRFDQDMSMVEIAKLTGSSVPTLHRRLDKSVKQLRLALSQAGFDPRDVVNLIGHHSIALSPLLRAEVERFLGPVRLSKRDG
ncbi:MAG TPA: sigma-70 family RNA polymerase sigma factor [Vicinamibacterales bacterium]|nr:sigma-70 family RNA polymerase sigma factor [Vicinamibacterales bacterium]